MHQQNKKFTYWSSFLKLDRLTFFKMNCSINSKSFKVIYFFEIQKLVFFKSKTFSNQIKVIFFCLPAFIDLFQLSIGYGFFLRVNFLNNLLTCWTTWSNLHFVVHRPAQIWQLLEHCQLVMMVPRVSKQAPSPSPAWWSWRIHLWCHHFFTGSFIGTGTSRRVMICCCRWRRRATWHVIKTAIARAFVADCGGVASPARRTTRLMLLILGTILRTKEK